MTKNVLVLVSFGLVLLATILLVVGLLGDDLTLIYLSIAASFVAAVVLYVAFRRARPKPETDREAPAPIPPEGAEAELAEEEPTTVTPAVAAASTTTPEAVVAAAEEPAEPEPEPEPADVAATGAAADDWTSDDDWADGGDFEVEFPIADYDDLSVAEIMPLLPQLYSDELGVVADRERKGKNRATILSRLDELAATGTEADALEAASVDADEAFAPEAAPATASAGDAARDDTLATPRPDPGVPQVPSLSDDGADDGFVFPIADYDELSVDQIVPLLAQLEDDELEDVKAREAAGQGRKSVIAEIDRQLGLVDAIEPAATAGGDDGWAQTPEPAATPEPAQTPDARPAPETESAEGSVLAIAGYDGLTVAQIRPLLNGLSHDELRAVLDHEVARDNRRTIVNEIERRLDSAQPAPEPEPAAAPARATKAPARKTAKKAAAKKATTKRAAAKKAARSTKAPAKKASRPTKKAAAAPFPIADYDTLTVAKIRPQLATLSPAELRQVQAREEQGAGRKTILNEIASRLG